jgi:RimJ/RimL family protein N-acetyltransferase
MDLSNPLVVSPVILEGRHVRLEPLSIDHLDALCEVGLHPDLWRWNPTVIKDSDGMLTYIQAALKWQAEGSALPFVIIERSSSKVVGSTRFANIDKTNKHVEIGWTWIGPQWQRTRINTEMKYLLLRHAFDTLGCLRVELKTDVLNDKSRNAILRIGAKQEGIFRSHVVVWDGRIRDTVYFSVIAAEWPDVRRRFETELLSRA